MMTSKCGFAKILEDEVKKARFSEQQIIEILKLAEARLPSCIASTGWRYRIGDYRLIYDPGDNGRRITLISFEPRGDVYE